MGLLLLQKWHYRATARKRYAKFYTLFARAWGKMKICTVKHRGVEQMASS